MKKLITIKFKEYVPIKDTILIKLKFSEKQKKQEMERKKELEKSMAFGEYRYFRKSNTKYPT